MTAHPIAPALPWKRDLLLLLALNTCNHVQNAAARFAVLLFALHQGASPLVVGMLVGLNSLVPAFSSVSIGRWLDKRSDMRGPLLFSSVGTMVAVLLPFLWESIVALFLFSLISGSAFNVFRIGSQQITGRYGKPEDRPRNYTYYSQALAAGNLLAPLVAGFAIDHAGFQVAFLLLGLLALPPILVLFLRRIRLPSGEPIKDSGPAASAKQNVLTLLRLPQLRRVLIAGAALMAVWDAFTFAWPLYGSELRFSASQIGLVASIFFSGTFIVRVLANALLRHFSQWQLLLTAMSLSSLMFLGFPFLSNMAALAALAFTLGLVLGIIQPMTMSLVYDEAPADRKGEVIGLRLTMAFTLHIAMPLLAGAMASALGLASIWWLAAATLMAGVWATRDQWHYRRH